MVMAAPFEALYQVRPGRGRRAGGRGRVDDAAAALLAHQGHDLQRRQIDRLHVDGENAVEFLFPDLQHRAVDMGNAGIVDHGVEAAVAVDRRADHGLHVVPVGDIGMDVGAADLVGHLFAELVVQVGADDARAFRGIAPGDGFAEAGGRAGDDGDLVLELHGETLRWSGGNGAVSCPTGPALATGREAPLRRQSGQATPHPRTGCVWKAVSPGDRPDLRRTPWQEFSLLS